MATVVLTAVGAVFGGPVGAAIGLAAGIAIDSELAQQGTREGPRLGDLRVQTSRYGSAIPKLFGRTRVSGTVIWSTDLIETRGLQSNGKGKGNTANYSYSASFAVVLSARQVLRVERIWADGNLLRGSAGDFKTATGFRLLTGSEDQSLDPLIAGAEGIGVTPAYRGRAIAVFEDFQLAAYGNRIPSLSFEVIADEGALSATNLIGELTDGAVTGDSADVVNGIAVTGDSIRAVASALGEALPLSLRDNGEVLELVGHNSVARSLVGEDFGSDGGETRTAALRVPEALSLAYYDDTRDYQPGVQRARRDGGARREDVISLAAVLDAGTAKRIVEARLSALWRERRQLVVGLPWRAIDLRPGDKVTVPGQTGDWRIAALAFERMALRLTLVPAMPAGTGSIPNPIADPGRSLVQIDMLHGPTTLVVLDLPVLTDAADTQARVVVAANGESSGWRGAPLLVSVDGGVNYVSIGGTAPPAIMGRSLGLLGSASAMLIDHINSIDVQLLNDAMSLADADGAALSAGANMSVIGNELLQFGKAIPIGGNRWRLSVLWRGRRGTESAVGSHTNDEPFVLLDPASLAAIRGDYAVDGLRVRATGIGDGANGTEAAIVQVGRAVTPLSPVRLRAVSRNDSGFDLDWVRRSREGWAWRDAVDVALGEEREIYRITRTGSGLAPLMEDCETSAWTYTAAQRAADVTQGATTVSIAVSQLGSQRLSDPTTLTLSVA